MTSEAITWMQSGDRTTWVASASGAVLTVTRLSVDRWQPVVEWAGGDCDRGPIQPRRKAAQAWCMRQVKGR